MITSSFTSQITGARDGWFRNRTVTPGGTSTSWYLKTTANRTGSYTPRPGRADGSRPSPVGAAARSIEQTPPLSPPTQKRSSSAVRERAVRAVGRNIECDAPRSAEQGDQQRQVSEPDRAPGGGPSRAARASPPVGQARPSGLLPEDGTDRRRWPPSGHVAPPGPGRRTRAPQPFPQTDRRAEQSRPEPCSATGRRVPLLLLVRRVMASRRRLVIDRAFHSPPAPPRRLRGRSPTRGGSPAAASGQGPIGALQSPEPARAAPAHERCPRP